MTSKLGDKVQRLFDSLADSKLPSLRRLVTAAECRPVMAREGYFGRKSFSPGLTISHIPRQTGLGSHVANVKRQNSVTDAATIFARHRGFLPPDTEVSLSPAQYQNFAAAAGEHAAHAVKRLRSAGWE